LKDVAIIGGGLAGLINAIQLADSGFSVCVIERKSYPFHRVCGEYVSNETLPFLKAINAYPDELEPANISRFQLSSASGNSLQMPLDAGGFGISRYKFDEFLYKKALAKGVEFILGTKVNTVNFQDDIFTLKLSNSSQLHSKIAIGAFGKRSNLDKELDREFFRQRSPYIGVKYHIKADFPGNTIALHNFKNGYCGINAIEENKICVCYLTTRENLRQYGNIPEMEKQLLHKNPFLEKIFKEADHLYPNPEVINEISFAPKTPVENHILMSGDAAGMITPLCGNGMAMAIHSAKILSGKVIDYLNDKNKNRQKLEEDYTKEWNNLFAERLWTGRKIQALFGKEIISEIAVGACKNIKPLAKYVMHRTHGKPF
jgi:menaquinone-9 beta-reductase